MEEPTMQELQLHVEGCGFRSEVSITGLLEATRIIQVRCWRKTWPLVEQLLRTDSSQD